MEDAMGLTRRVALAQLSAGALLPACAAAETALQPTPAQAEGPFHPVNTPVERDADLTRLAGRAQRATGPIIEVRGRVFDALGAPVSGARLEIWQANAAGRYSHPRDNGPGPLDPNFQGCALLESDADGRFSVVSVKPGAYRTGPDRRAPHLHWKVASGARRLTTQMYFPGGGLNESDPLIRRARNPRPLIARVDEAAEPGALGFAWEIVLQA
jgi:protocatechuate 3,4-dioxygenase beta subunit